MGCANPVCLQLTPISKPDQVCAPVTRLNSTYRRATSFALNLYVSACVDPLLVSFARGDQGLWKVERIEAVREDGLPAVPFLAVVEGRGAALPDAAWVLRGVTSNKRYTSRDELDRSPLAC